MALVAIHFYCITVQDGHKGDPNIFYMNAGKEKHIGNCVNKTI